MRLARIKQWLAGLAGLAALALSSCGGIGDGSTVQTIRVVFSPTAWDQAAIVNDADPATRSLLMYDCFCANVALESTFTDGTITYGQGYRATWSSSDTSIVTVQNYGDAVTTACPLAQNGVGLLTPKAPGTARITATFLGKTATLDVTVSDTDGAALTLAPADTTNAGQVAVGATLPMRISGTLDNRTRSFNLNVMSWAFTPANDAVATVSTIGVVTGKFRDGGAAQTLQANFSCTDVTPQAQIRVGDVLPPLRVAEETDFNGAGQPLDALMAVNSTQFLNITAPLDFDHDGTEDAQQLISTQAGASFTDACVVRDHDPADLTGTTCREVASTCDTRTSLSVCSNSPATTCIAGMAACRTVAAPMSMFGTNQVLALSDTGTTANFFATYPYLRGAATTLSAGIDDTTTTLTVVALSGYPGAFPWYGVIDDANAGTREVVRVTAVSGTTLTVDRGLDSTAQAHASGVSFSQRTYTSDDANRLPLTAKAGTLTTLTLEAPGTLAPLDTLQMQAVGNFHNDTDNSDRTQRVTRLSALATGAPATAWTSSDEDVAFFNASFPALLTSATACGGTIVARARASTSTNTDDSAFVKPTAVGDATDLDSNNNTDANDTACLGTDPLCDQVTITIAKANPLPPGVTCN